MFIFTIFRDLNIPILKIYIIYFIINIKLLILERKMRANIEYFDISMANINSIILIFAALILQANILLMIINLISIGVLCGLSIYTFSQHNPYYVVSCYVLAVFGFIFTIVLLNIPELLYYSMISPLLLFILILILNTCFGASLLKGSANSRAFIGKTGRLGRITRPETLILSAIKDRKRGTHINNSKNTRKLMQEKYQVGFIVLQ